MAAATTNLPPTHWIVSKFNSCHHSESPIPFIKAKGNIKTIKKHNFHRSIYSNCTY